MFDRLDLLRPVAAPDRATFDARYEAPERPAVFEGSRPAVAVDATPEAIAEAAPDLELEGFGFRDGHAVFDPRTGLVPERMRAADFAVDVRSAAPTIRVRQRQFDRLPRLPGPPPPQAAGKLRLHANLWISPSGACTRLHYDQPHTLLVQLVGTKRVLLFPAGERLHLYPCSLRSATPQFSRIDVAARDWDHFPETRSARGFRVELSPGRTLFIPSGWWHYLEADDLTVSLGWSWWARKHALRLALGDAFKRLRGLAK